MGIFLYSEGVGKPMAFEKAKAELYMERLFRDLLTML